MQILNHHMKDVTTEHGEPYNSSPMCYLRYSNLRSAGVDAMVIARGTPGFSGADLQNMVNMAAVQASREGAKAVDLKHFEWAKVRHEGQDHGRLY